MQAFGTFLHLLSSVNQHFCDVLTNVFEWSCIRPQKGKGAWLFSHAPFSFQEQQTFFSSLQQVPCQICSTGCTESRAICDGWGGRGSLLPPDGRAWRRGSGSNWKAIFEENPQRQEEMVLPPKKRTPTELPRLNEKLFLRRDGRDKRDKRYGRDGCSSVLQILSSSHPPHLFSISHTGTICGLGVGKRSSCILASAQLRT